MAANRESRAANPAPSKTPASGKRSGTANGTDVVADAQVDESPSRVVESYTYTDGDGRKLFQVRRYESKQFRQFRWTGTRWVPGLKGVAPVLYRLPEVIAAVAAGKTIYVPEGERDVHTLEVLGLVATTNPAGAGKWRSEFNEWLRGARVCIVMDWDPPAKKAKGQAHALKVYDSLQGVAASVELFRPAKGCKDVTDHVDAGRSLDDLVPMTAEKLRWHVDAHGTPIPAAAAVPTGAERAAGVPLVLATVVGLLAGRGQVVPPRDPGGDWQVCCPVHEDRNPSATLRAGTDRPVIFKCHAGCGPAEFLDWCQRQGVPLGDLMEGHP